MYNEIYSTIITPDQFQAINHLACAWVVGGFIVYNRPNSTWWDRFMGSLAIVFGSMAALGF